MDQVEAIVHNSPALDSLKHQQLRSLCARHGLKSTGKKDHLIKRLKALRETSSIQDGSSEEGSNVASPLDGSFDILDEEEAEEAQQYSGTLPGSFESHTRPSFVNSRVSIDEFGSLSADAHTISKSSSWKDKLASVFGGPALSTSSSSDSLSSIRTTRAGVASSSRAGDNLPSQQSSYASEAYSKAGNTFKQPSSFVNAIASTSTSTRNTNQAPPPASQTPAFRIVEDSFVQANSTYPDCSFVPRSSFEGDSVDLANVPVWPPPPGVILISPRQSPKKPFNAQQAQQTMTSQRIPMSAQKRYLHDLEEDDDDDMMNEEEEGKYGSIRLIPRLPLLESAMTPGRKIAALPKKMSLIASSPPRFDLEAPPLPSFATVANQAIRQGSSSLQVVDGQEGDSSGSTVIMENDHEDDAKPSSDTLESINENAPPQQPFVFGSPRQQPLTDDSFLKRIDGFAIAKQLEELQRRTGVVPSSSNKSVSLGPDGRPQHSFMPRTASSGNLQAKNGVRFEGKHKKEFKMMDSIANHYAAKRNVSNGEMKKEHQPNKRTRTESADAVTVLSATQNAKTIQNTVHKQASCPALSLSNNAGSSSLSLNQQGRYAPAIPPRPKNTKSSTQQAEDRELIRNMQSGHNFASSSSGATQRRAGRVSISPRKAAVNPSTRKLPPLPSASLNVNTHTNSLNSNSTGTASKLFKSTFSSLKSFGSASSLSSKATLGGGMTSSTSSKSIHIQSQHVSDFGTLQQRTPAVTAHGSVTRPTIASLARQQSRQDLDSLASPRQALSPRPITATDRLNIVSPRTGSTLEKKKISSISASHRSSPMKGNLDDSIAQARRIRAKKLGSQVQTNQSSISSSTNASSSSTTMSRSPSKISSLSSSHPTTGSVSSRPAWR